MPYKSKKTNNDNAPKKQKEILFVHESNAKELTESVNAAMRDGWFYDGSFVAHPAGSYTAELRRWIDKK